MIEQGERIDWAAPMAPARMRYNDDGSAAWGEMWDSYCLLALDGGPPHRATLLRAEPTSDVAGGDYQRAVAEIVRGIGLVSGLPAAPAAPGLVAVACQTAGMARWLADAIGEENVEARARGTTLLVPAGASYTLTGEIKNVITAVAKTTHYWREHLPLEVKQALEVQERFGGVRDWFGGWLRRRPAGADSRAGQRA
jgi:sirohydrochlorin cobaltochelatase